VFSMGVNEGYPQASRPACPAEHACIVFHIHIVSICGRGEHRYDALPLRKSVEATSFAIACCCCRAYRWTSSPFRRAQPRRPRWSCEGVIPPLSFATADSFNFQHDAGRHSLVLQNCSGWSSGQDGGLTGGAVDARPNAAKERMRDTIAPLNNETTRPRTH
jgi:hypothetical protein